MNPLLDALSSVKNPNLADLEDIGRIPPKALIDALVTQGANLAGLPMDMAYLAQSGINKGMDLLGVPNPYPLGELKDTVMTSDWMADKAGVDTESIPYLVGSMLTPDPSTALKFGPLMQAIGSLVGAKRMSKAEAEALGYWHPVGVEKKLPKPVDEVVVSIGEHEQLKPRVSINPEQMQGGVIIPAYGDRSRAGHYLAGVDGVPFDDHILMEGGHDFMRRSPDAIWASGKSQISALNNKAVEALEQGKDPYLTFLPMGHASMNHNTMMADVILEQMKGMSLPKTVKKSFDAKVKTLRPDWKGIDSPESLAQIENNGEVRKAFMQVAALDEFQNAGMPNPAIARIALTDPSLMDLPIGMGGQAIGRASGEILENPALPHKTYNTQMGGEYVGGFDQPIPREILFPDWFAGRRAENKPISSDHRSFELSRPTQDANQEWLDRLMGFLGR